MYNQLYIDSVGEKFFDNIIAGTSSYTVDKNKKSFDDQRIYFAFQHYLVKCFVNKKNIDLCKKHVIKYYNDFNKEPYKFSNSPLIRNDALDLLFGENENCKKIKNYRNNYFDQNEVYKLSSESKVRELTNEEKNRYFSYLICVLKSDNKKIKEIIEFEIKKIINNNRKVSEMNETELQFYSQYISNLSLEISGHKNITTTVLIGEESEYYKGVQCHNTIVINRNTNSSLAILTKTICHESTHSIQEYASKNSENLKSFEMAQMTLFSKYLDFASYDSYHSNYKYSSIEIDAEKDGHFNSSVIMGMFGRRDLSDEIFESRKNNLDKRNYYGFMIDKTGKALPIDTFIVKNFDEIIKNNPTEINNYPVLNNFYNKDGSKKSFDEILYGRMTQSIDNRGVYDNYINYAIFYNQLDTLKLNNISSDNTKKMFSTLSSIYRDRMLVLNDHFKDEPNLDKLNEKAKQTAIKQIQNTTIYQINVATNLLKFINNNFDRMIDTYNERINNTSFIYDFIYDLRDFNVSKIKNESIKNSPEVLEKIKNLLKIHNEVLKKYNYYMVKQRLNLLDEKKRNSVINIEGEDMTFEDYVMNYALNAMDSHQNIIVDNKQMYIGDFIALYNKNENNSTFKM